MLACKEALLGLADTGVITDTLTITATAKPPTAQVIENLSIPYTPKQSVCDEIKFNRITGQVKLNFTNLDAQTAHTIYYQVYVDNALVIDRSTGFSISSGSTLAKTELIYQVNPADAAIAVSIFFWVDTASQIVLNDHRIRAGFGSESASAAVIKIEKESMQAVYAEFATTHSGGTYAFALKAFASGVTLVTGAGALSKSDLLPYTELYLTPQTNEIVYLTAISLV
jgi:hypothetical protein